MERETIRLECKDVIKEINANTRNNKLKIINELLLFFSFDIVDSSKYKKINYYGWFVVINKLFKKISDDVREHIPDAELWRALGDEIIFIVKVPNEEKLTEYMDQIYKILLDEVKDLRTGIIFDMIAKSMSSECENLKRQNILSLKGASWIAVVTSNIDSNINGEYENIYSVYSTDEKYNIPEFLGNDIDAGFRIKQYTCDRRLVISYELAVLLCRRAENLEKINIITYKKLKGIWDGRLYPIIWYYDKKHNVNKQFEQSFYYDEINDNELVNDYFNRYSFKGILNSEIMFKDINKSLNIIGNDNKLNIKIEKMISAMESIDKEKKYTRTSLLELHCPSICFDRKSGKILVCKRSDTKSILSGLWDFGCAKADLRTPLVQSIKEQYKKKFNLDIEPIVEKRGEKDEPVNIGMYEVEKEGALHKGVITISEIKQSIDNYKREADNHYSEIKFITKNEIESFKNDEAVDGFKETLKVAFKYIEKMYSKKTTNERERECFKS